MEPNRKRKRSTGSFDDTWNPLNHSYSENEIFSGFVQDNNWPGQLKMSTPQWSGFPSTEIHVRAAPISVPNPQEDIDRYLSYGEEISTPDSPYGDSSFEDFDENMEPVSPGSLDGISTPLDFFPPHIYPPNVNNHPTLNPIDPQFNIQLKTPNNNQINGVPPIKLEPNSNTIPNMPNQIHQGMDGHFKLVDELIINEKNIEVKLNQICQDIKQSNLPMPKEMGTMLYNDLCAIEKASEDLINQCNEIEQRFLLLPSKLLHSVHFKRIEFKKHQIQAEIFKREVEHCISHSDYGDIVVASLFIVSQPFPTTIKQFLTVDPIDVKLLKGAKTQIAVLEPVTAHTVNDWSVTTSKKSSPPMKGEREHLHQDIVTFGKLKFTIGTGCKAVQIKFSVKVQSVQGSKNSFQQGRGMPVYIESNSTEPFIVMTNTKQWSEAQGILIKKEMFQSNTTVTSQRFCNSLQFHYMQASKQDPGKAFRPLSGEDFNFFFTRKFKRPYKPHDHVTLKEFDDFWEWFGPVLQKIRYQKFLLPMWTSGLFWGFLSKNEAERQLMPCTSGTFLLRFSEGSPGQMAVAYKQGPDAVRHYLIKPKDTAGQGRSLPQFIRETNSLIYFLKMSFGENMEIKKNLIEKNQALQKISKPPRLVPPNKDSSLYDDEIVALKIDHLSLSNQV